MATQHYNFASTGENSITWTINYQLVTGIFAVSSISLSTFLIIVPFHILHRCISGKPSWVFMFALIPWPDKLSVRLILFGSAYTGIDTVSVGRNTGHQTGKATTQLLPCYLELEGLERSAPSV